MESRISMSQLRLREDPPLVGRIHMPRFDAQRFLRPASGFPSDDEQFVEMLIRDSSEDGSVLSSRDHDFAVFRRWHFHLGDRIPIEVSLPDRPTQASLDAADVVAAGRDRQFVTVHPLLHVVRLEFGDLQIGVLPSQSLQPVTIPLEGIGRAVLLSPVQVDVDRTDERLEAHRSNRLRLPPASHHLVVAIEGGIAVGTEIDLTAVDLDVPQVPGRTEKRPREMDIAKPPACAFRTHQSGPKGSRPRRDAGRLL